TQVNGLEQAEKNIQDGISLLQTMDGGFEEITSILQRIRSLAVQSANDTLTSDDRNLIQLEINQLLSEIDILHTSVQFNTKQLFNPQNIQQTAYDSSQAGTNAVMVKSTGNYLDIPLYTNDGRLIYSEFTGAGGGGDFEIWIETAKDSGIFTNITNAPALDQSGWVLSPDGQTIYFNEAPWMGGSNPNVGKVNIDGTGKTVFAWNTGSCEVVLGVSRDGSKIIVGKGAISTVNWYYANSDGTGGLNLITNRTGTASNSAAFSRDGNALFYTAQVGGVYQLFSMPSDDSGPSTQLTFGTENYHPNLGIVSYNTTDKLLVTREKVAGSGQYGLYTMNYDGSGIQFLDILPGASISAPKISPDDSWIVFSSNENGQWDIWKTHSGVPTIDNSGAVPENNNIVIHCGANKDQTIEIELNKINTTTLSINNLSVLNQISSETTLNKVDAALQKISEYRSFYGAKYNRLEHIKNFSGISKENQTSSESRIRDLDFAEQFMKYTKNQILHNASVSMLAQANINRSFMMRFA
ncbi:MAG TPA: flagellin, partial [bacterium]|nr:flagellin [bacterium]